jgi:ubiquinone/menaquinone biosynthesis C-methylase UbiE
MLIVTLSVKKQNMNPQGKKATPELEDFGHKYQSRNPLNQMLIDNYFKTVAALVTKVKLEITTAVEIGAGEGHSTVLLQQMLGDKVKFTASEYVQANVDKAKQMFPQIDFIQEDIYKLQRADKSADLIFLLEVLEHLEDPVAALRELNRVGSKYLILGVPREPLWRVLNFARGKYLKDWGNTTGHLNHWSSSAIKDLVSKEFGPVIELTQPLPWTILLAKKA